MRTSESSIISMSNVSHYYGSGALRKQVLFDVTCDIRPGEIVIITGPSGSGKTTVLTLAGALRSVEHGSMRVLGQELNGAGHAALVSIRGSIGFIFQTHNLLDSLTAAQNVRMSLGLDSISPREARARSLAMLEAVGLSEYIDYLPRQLSGGQRQRVAIARAVVRQPKIILADEPTAALDKQSGRDVVELLRLFARRLGCAVLLVTHDNRILDIADRIMLLEDGRLGSFDSAISPHAGHLLTVLSQMQDNEYLWLMMDRTREGEFIEMLKKMGSEVEQFLNILELGNREAVGALLDGLLETILLKITQLLEAGAAGLFTADGTQLRAVLDPPAWPQPELAARAVATRQIVNASGPGLGPGVQSALCVPIPNRIAEIRAVVQLVNKKTGGSFTEADERAFRDFAAPLGVIVEGWQRVKETP